MKCFYHIYPQENTFLALLTSWEQVTGIFATSVEMSFQLVKANVSKSYNFVNTKLNIPNML